MLAGDLVSYLDERWAVIRVDDSVRMVLLVNQSGRRVEVPDNTGQEEGLQVVAHPPTNWQLIAFPSKRLTGPVVRITIPNPFRDRELESWVDWIPSDPLREGGTLYFNPSLGLKLGQVLQATFRNGHRSRITVPRNFGTVSQRVEKVRLAALPHIAPEERTRFNRDFTMDDEDEEG